MKMIMCLFLLLVLVYVIHHLHVVLFLLLYAIVFMVASISKFFSFIRLEKKFKNRFDIVPFILGKRKKKKKKTALGLHEAIVVPLIILGLKCAYFETKRATLQKAKPGS